MCIIFVKPEGILLTKETLENCFKSNSHGAGFMTAIAGELIVKKGFFSFEEFWEAYIPFQYENIVGHFRWATHGAKNTENCHPFLVSDDLGFVHNGVLHNIHKAGSQMSDTWHFGEAIIKPLVKEFPDIWKHKTMKYLITKSIGNFNKFAFLHANGKVAIYNEEKGTKKFGCWFSNTDFETSRYRNSQSNYSSANNYGMYGSYNGCGHYPYNNNVKKNIPEEKEKKEQGVQDNGKIFIATDNGLVPATMIDGVIIPDEQDVIVIKNKICDNCCESFPTLIESKAYNVCKDCVELLSVV